MVGDIQAWFLYAQGVDCAAGHATADCGKLHAGFPFAGCTRVVTQDCIELWQAMSVFMDELLTGTFVEACGLQTKVSQSWRLLRMPIDAAFWLSLRRGASEGFQSPSVCLL